MEEADIVICGGGQTLYEAASQGLPPVIVTLIANQKDDVREFVQAGFGIHVGNWDRPDLFDAVIDGMRQLWPLDARCLHAAAGQRYVDGLGAQRLAETLLVEWGSSVTD
jgi:spore coat polysaccharide biosynthesis predicted glycosyltransferase SpsG